MAVLTTEDGVPLATEDGRLLVTEDHVVDPIPADPIAALVQILQSENIASGRVYGGELPRTETDLMPREAVVLVPAGGGLLGTGYQQYGDRRIDVRCYAATPSEAHALHLAARNVLKQLPRTIAAGCLVHWAKPSSDGTSLRDPDTDWPVVFSSWQVLTGDVTV